MKWTKIVRASIDTIEVILNLEFVVHMKCLLWYYIRNGMAGSVLHKVLGPRVNCFCVVEWDWISNKMGWETFAPLQWPVLDILPQNRVLPFDKRGWSNGLNTALPGSVTLGTRDKMQALSSRKLFLCAQHFSSLVWAQEIFSLTLGKVNWGESSGIRNNVLRKEMIFRVPVICNHAYTDPFSF